VITYRHLISRILIGQPKEASNGQNEVVTWVAGSKKIYYILQYKSVNTNYI
jgi:hypothetical protein